MKYLANAAHVIYSFQNSNFKNYDNKFKKKKKKMKYLANAAHIHIKYLANFEEIFFF